MNVRGTVYITLFVLAICLAVALIVFWNIYIIRDYLIIRDLQEILHGEEHHVPSAGRWIVLAAGITAGVVLIVALSLFFGVMMRSHLLKRQQRDFSNMMTHELRLPLAGIQIFAQTLRQRPLDPGERDRFADGILSECARLGMLIDQLLKIQQLEHRQLMLHKKFLDAGELARDFAAKWPRPLTLNAAEDLRVEADPLLLEMSLANLVSNAEKYGRGSVPELRVEREGNNARFTVRDGGRPLQRQHLKKVFRKFYRIPNLTTRRQSGVGLGLYIVRSIARLHRGDASARPITSPITGPNGEGNAFSFWIPLAPNRTVS